MFDLTVDLGQSLFAAHGQDRVTESNKQDHQCQVADPGPEQPAERFVGERNHAGM